MNRASLLLLAAIPGVVWGQTEAASDFNPLRAKSGGVSLQGVSVYSGYYAGQPPASFELPLQSSFLSATGMVGVTATVGATKSDEKTTFSWRYSPSYFRIVYSEQDRRGDSSVNHRGAVNWSRKLGNKWTLTASANGLLANLEQLYFNPGVFSTVAAMPLQFDDLAGGMLTGKYTDAQLASALTGASLQASPEQGYLYGTRMLNVAATVGLAWAVSGRTSLSATLTGSRAQHVDGDGAGGTTGASSGLVLPQMTTAGVSVGWAYSLSPRTQIGVDVSSSRTFSRLQRGYASRAAFSIGRTMSRRWFLQARGGAGALTYQQEVYANPRTAQYLYGGSIGYKTMSHTFLVSYDRSLGDAYALGSDSTSTATGAWNWHHPGSEWSISVSGGFQQLHNQIFSNTKSWRATAGVARSLGPNISMTAQYVYFQLPASIQRGGLDVPERGVSIALTWLPAR